MSRTAIIIYRVLLFGLGGLFIWASVNKLIHPLEFAESISQYKVLPDVLVNPAALVLPALEFFAGAALILYRPLRSAASLWILVMLLVFTAAIASAVYRGIDISCGCFSTSPESSKVGIKKLVENSGLILAALIVFLRSIRLDRLER